MQSKATIVDIAKAVGVSLTQVSRALNGRPKVAPEIRSRILETAKKINYRNCAKNHRPHIALVVSNVDLYNYPFLNYFLEEAETRNWNCSIVNKSVPLSEYIYDGVIAISVEDNFSKKWFQKSSLPMVILNGYGFGLEEIPSVEPDCYDESYIVLKHLKELGHTRILRVHEYHERSSEEGKKRGTQEFYRAAADLNLPAENISFSHGEDCGQILKDALKKGFSALFVLHVSMAVWAQQTLLGMGVRIPEDLSLVTYEVENVSKYLSPPPTTLEFNYPVLLKRAFEEVSKRMRHPSSGGPVVIRVPNILHVRETTAPVSGKKCR